MYAKLQGVYTLLLCVNPIWNEFLLLISTKYIITFIERLPIVQKFGSLWGLAFILLIPSFLFSHLPSPSLFLSLYHSDIPGSLNSSLLFRTGHFLTTSVITLEKLHQSTSEQGAFTAEISVSVEMAVAIVDKVMFPPIIMLQLPK